MSAGMISVTDEYLELLALRSRRPLEAVVGEWRRSQDLFAVSTAVHRSRAAHSAAAELPAPKLRRDASPTYTVRIAAGTRDAIGCEIRGALQSFNGVVETGGWAYSVYPSGEDWVELCHASGPGPSSKHASALLHLSLPEEIELDECLAQLVRVGDWHSHVAGEGVPSSQDMRGWASGLYSNPQLNAWVGVIATAAEGGIGWSHPDLNVWIVRPADPESAQWRLGGPSKDRGQLVCEPARLEEV